MRTALAGSPLTGGSFFSLTGAHKLPQAGSPLTGGSFSCTADRGTRTAAGGISPTGGFPFLDRGTRTAAGGFPLTGGSFCTRLRGHTNRRRRVGKRQGFFLPCLSGNLFCCGRLSAKGRTCGFIFRRRRFPCFLIAQISICDRFDMGNGRGFFLPCLSQPIRNVRYRSATHAVSSPQARHVCVAQLVCALLRTAPANYN